MEGRIGEILLLIVLALILFGGDKLPGIGRSLGSALHEFKKAVNSKPDDGPAKSPQPSDAQTQAPRKRAAASSRRKKGSARGRKASR